MAKQTPIFKIKRADPIFAGAFASSFLMRNNDFSYDMPINWGGAPYTQIAIATYCSFHSRYSTNAAFVVNYTAIVRAVAALVAI